MFPFDLNISLNAKRIESLYHLLYVLGSLFSVSMQRGLKEGGREHDTRGA